MDETKVSVVMLVMKQHTIWFPVYIISYEGLTTTTIFTICDYLNLLLTYFL